MLWLILGGLVLVAFLGGLRSFEKAQVATIKSLAAWVAALGGLSLAVLLFVSGRGSLALSGLLLLGPLLWEYVRGTRQAPTSASRGEAPRPRPQSAMTREEAWQVLGLQPGADAEAIRAAHRRLMRGAHPDGGGSDWLAARVNQARDVLLGGSRT